MEVPRFKRLQHTMIRFWGEVCPSCDAKLFPPRAVCPECRGNGKYPQETVKPVNKGDVFLPRQLVEVNVVYY